MISAGGRCAGVLRCLDQGIATYIHYHSSSKVLYQSYLAKEKTILVSQEMAKLWRGVVVGERGMTGDLVTQAYNTPQRCRVELFRLWTPKI